MGLKRFESVHFTRSDRSGRILAIDAGVEQLRNECVRIGGVARQQRRAQHQYGIILGLAGAELAVDGVATDAETARELEPSSAGVSAAADVIGKTAAAARRRAQRRETRRGDWQCMTGVSKKPREEPLNYRMAGRFPDSGASATKVSFAASRRFHRSSLEKRLQYYSRSPVRPIMSHIVSVDEQTGR